MCLMQVASIDHHHLPQCVSIMTMCARVLITSYVEKKTDMSSYMGSSNG